MICILLDTETQPVHTHLNLWLHTTGELCKWNKRFEGMVAPELNSLIFRNAEHLELSLDFRVLNNS